MLPEGRDELLCENEPGLQCVHGFEATMTRGPISLVCAIAASNSRSAASKSRSVANNSRNAVNNSRSAAWSTTQELEVQPAVQEADQEGYGRNECYRYASEKAFWTQSTGK